MKTSMLCVPARRLTAAAAVAALAGVAHGQLSENFDSTSPGSLPAGWSTSVTGGGSAWTVVNTQANSGSNSVFSNDIGSVSSQYLYLPSGTATGAVTLDLFSYYITENTFDGWVVESSINGSPYTNIGQSAWTLNGYNNTISTAYGSAIAGQQAFSGTSAFWAESTATITANVGDQVSLRINMSSDSSVASTGVWLDNISVSNITLLPTGACCQPDGSCVVVSSSACAAGGGAYHGNNSTCAAANCPVPAFQNGSFESGSFTPGWTQFGDGEYSAVDTVDFDNIPAEDGTYCAHFGPVGDTGGINQVVAARAGDTITIDFWYQAQGAADGPNSFSADFDGQNLVSFSDDAVNTFWTEFNYQRTASVDNPVLSFTFQNDPNYDYLDNVVVTVTSHQPTCYANCDQSTGTPFLNVADFTCFFQKFATGNSYANCDGSTASPVLNVQDFTCFLQKFALGCSAP
jgi:hypothetical protein